MIDATATQAKIEAGIGVGLMTTPAWVFIIQDISLVASCIAAVCGAIIGMHAVYRIMRRSKQK